MVLGSSGFIGHVTVRSLLQSDSFLQHEIVGYDLKTDDTISDKRFHFTKGDALNPASLRDVLSRFQPQYVINCTGSFREDDLDDHIRMNTVPTRELCVAAVEGVYAPEKILVIGSAAEYGTGSEGGTPLSETVNPQPVTAYGLSKYMQTLIGQFFYRTHGTPIIVARTFNVRGMGISDQLAIGSWNRQIQNAKSGDTIITGNLESARDYLDVNQVANYFLCLLRNGEPGTVYNVCSGKAVKMRSILEEMIEESGKNLSVRENVLPGRQYDHDVVIGDNTRLLSKCLEK